mgnify:CR=1 FL=1
MPSILTKSDIQFDEMRVYRTVDLDGTTVHWWLTVGYDLTTIEGEIIHRDRRLEITAAGQKTTLNNWFSAIKTRILADEGI